MATPKGTRAQRITTESGEAVHIYSTAAQIVLQLRKEVATDPKAASFKVAVTLTPAEALSVTGELLTVAARQITAKG